MEIEGVVMVRGPIPERYHVTTDDGKKHIFVVTRRYIQASLNGSSLWESYWPMGPWIKCREG